MLFRQFYVFTTGISKFLYTKVAFYIDTSSDNRNTLVRGGFVHSVNHENWKYIAPQ